MNRKLFLDFKHMHFTFMLNSVPVNEYFKNNSLKETKCKADEIKSLKHFSLSRKLDFVVSNHTFLKLLKGMFSHFIELMAFHSPLTSYLEVFYNSRNGKI